MNRGPTLGSSRRSADLRNSEPFDARAQERVKSQSRERGELSAETDDCGLLLEARRVHRKLDLSLVAEAARKWEAREARRRGRTSSRVGQERKGTTRTRT